MDYYLTVHRDPRQFHDAVFAHLMRSEAANCAVIGLVRQLHDHGCEPRSDDDLDQPLLWTVHGGHGLELVVVQTIKKGMLVTHGSEPAMKFLAAELVSRRWSGEMVIGICPSVETLSAEYAALSQRARSLACHLRAFQLERVTPTRPTTGAMQLCGPEHRETLARWMIEFHADIGEPFKEDPLARADRAIADQRIFLWIDKEPVAMAGFAGPTPNGIRINSVYTPPGFRRRLYASNLVATLTQHLLNQGRRYCFLFTDVANPTSNRIYQSIGYRQVSECERWRFTGRFGDTAESA